MSNPKSICNLGLGKIAASRVNNITTPSNPVERHCAEGYPQWKRSEIAKRRWICALRYEQLTQSGGEVTTPDDGRKYRYAKPTGCLRVIREKNSEFEVRGQYIYSAHPTLTIAFLKDIDEGEMDATLIDVIAARVAMESTEFATQSSRKTADAVGLYKEALDAAASVNAFQLEHGEFTTDDENDDWITARWG